MSKRWKVRKQNAAKLEKSREVLERFYDSVVTSLEEMKKQTANMLLAKLVDNGMQGKIQPLPEYYPKK